MRRDLYPASGRRDLPNPHSQPPTLRAELRSVKRMAELTLSRVEPRAEFTYARCAGEDANGCADLGGHLAAALQQNIVDIRLLKWHTAISVANNGVHEMNMR